MGQCALISPLQHWNDLEIKSADIENEYIVRKIFGLFLDQSGAKMQARRVSLSVHCTNVAPLALHCVAIYLAECLRSPGDPDLWFK